MSQLVTQNLPADIVVILTDAANVPVTGLTDADITVDFRKEGAGAFSPKALAGALTEIGDGVYTVAFTAVELDTVGSFTVKVNGAAIIQHVAISTVVAAGTAPTVKSVQTCVINGHVFDPSGRPVQGAGVGARILALPSIEQNDIGLSTSEVTAVTDANGEFFLTLVRLAEVDLTIPVMGYRRQLTVPNAASANLFTGIP